MDNTRVRKRLCLLLLPMVSVALAGCLELLNELSSHKEHSKDDEKETTWEPAAVDVTSRDKHGLTPLHRAARAGDLSEVNRLLSSGAAPNAKDRYTRTPLIYAAREGNSDVAATLVANGADVHARDKYGSLPLHYAAKGGHRAVVQTLLAAGADRTVKDGRGKTPADLARASHHDDVANLLGRKWRGTRHRK